MGFTTENPMQALTAGMTPKFAVSYLRVSTRGQAERGGGADEGFSIPAQREANKKKALSMGAFVTKEFVDRGASAKSADRPELQKMLEYVKENADRVDYVIVHKIDRLARNRGDDIDIMRTLRECGVQLGSAKGTVVYKDVEYIGNHTPIVAADIWQQVQNVLASHVNGERTREHPHFLKGSLYCRNCGSRMIITYAKSRSGVRYPYFVCAGRHSKRVKDCKQKAVLIGEIERQVEQLYDRYSFPPAVREYLENFLHDGIKAEQEKCAAETDGLRREKDKLERQRKKLLEAHYNDAIPLDLLKREQKSITKQLDAIEREIKMRKMAFSSVLERLSDAMELIEDCGTTYRLADDHIKRMMNQAIFSKIWVESDGRVTAEFAAPFNRIVEPVKDMVAQYNSRNKEKIRSTFVPADFFSVIANRLSNFFGNCLNNDFLVETAGLEPVTSCV